MNDIKTETIDITGRAYADTNKYTTSEKGKNISHKYYTTLSTYTSIYKFGVHHQASKCIFNLLTKVYQLTA